MTEISNPHDKFFKEVFTRKATAEEFLWHYLSENVVELLDLDSLEYSKNTFVDRHLKPKLSDFILDLHQSLEHQGLAKSLDISIGMPIFSQTLLHQDFSTFLRKKSLNLGWRYKKEGN